MLLKLFFIIITAFYSVDPRPISNWNGVLDTTSEKSICYQVSFNSEKENEDCLYVNVYTPVDPSSNSSLAVMFYIHGGGFMNGNSLFNSFGPHHFMDHDTVIVTVSYRLGPFGFLSTGDSVIPGNYGLKDQNMAMKWVQKNIGYFGGDPAKVTIFGQSSGAVSVGYQIVSKQSKGLFRGAIQQSGAVLTPHGYQRRAKDFAYTLAGFIDPNFNNTKGSAELLNFLQSVPAEEIDVATQKFTQGPGSMILSEGSWFAPVIESEADGAFITENMYESIACGDINKVPLMVGTTSEEALSQASGAERVTHSEDNRYIWVSNNSFDIGSIDNKDLRTVDRLVTLFTDFSKTLNPTPERLELLENIKWLKITQAHVLTPSCTPNLSMNWANEFAQVRVMQLNKPLLSKIHGLSILDCSE
ncbi:hypothetical protein NQ314_011710 [Rhamnusium bicolor]|uniref:Carboxylic ester hydrolase n=1 Tax=Rhamnusium bicolor TaxID=1586634 RepID=A0AAV8XI98_9CUCU|nr:hypothetical protein NQ314_011710 [Rhamnusium bicolor]